MTHTPDIHIWTPTQVEFIADRNTEAPERYFEAARNWADGFMSPRMCLLPYADEEGLSEFFGTPSDRALAYWESMFQYYWTQPVRGDALPMSTVVKGCRRVEREKYAHFLLHLKCQKVNLNSPVQLRRTSSVTWSSLVEAARCIEAVTSNG